MLKILMNKKNKNKKKKKKIKVREIIIKKKLFI